MNTDNTTTTTTTDAAAPPRYSLDATPAASGELHLFVRTLTGQTIDVDVPQSASVLDLKRRLEANHVIGVAPQFQRLIYQGCELRDEDALLGGAKPLVDQAVVHIVLRKPEVVNPQQQMAPALYNNNAGRQQPRAALGLGVGGAVVLHDMPANGGLFASMFHQFRATTRRVFAIYLLLALMSLIFFFARSDWFLALACCLFMSAAGMSRRISEAPAALIRQMTRKYWHGLRTLGLLYFAFYVLDASTEETEKEKEEAISRTSQVVNAFIAAAFASCIFWVACVYHAGRAYRRFSGQVVDGDMRRVARQQQVQMMELAPVARFPPVAMQEQQEALPQQQQQQQQQPQQQQQQGFPQQQPRYLGQQPWQAPPQPQQQQQQQPV
eukprot:NODE_1547_length_1297_cov_52.216239_g1533_i0.p2 GENE.NODE_1547_length_1297_cov_52.216239_g1533_i0~~NODE_1547_length_1297_cov_52.216239_g1533_i0.p2  ORF type:complete len:402 (+),score=126.16 NODE_1547_length_1297_cov_52.216239_g1533_i0:65-1207(+)